MTMLRTVASLAVVSMVILLDGFVFTHPHNDYGLGFAAMNTPLILFLGWVGIWDLKW